jgi:transcriptional regulator with XRE-family HTH domain
MSVKIFEPARLMGERIRENRKAKGLSQEKLAALAGVHRTYIGMIERGEKNLTIKSLCRVCRALKVAPSEIVSAIDHIAFQ